MLSQRNTKVAFATYQIGVSRVDRTLTIGKTSASTSRHHKEGTLLFRGYNSIVCDGKYKHELKPKQRQTETVIMFLWKNHRL